MFDEKMPNDEEPDEHNVCESNNKGQVWVKVPTEINKQYQKQNSKVAPIKSEQFLDDGRMLERKIATPETQPDASLTEPIQLKIEKCELCPFVSLKVNLFELHIDEHKFKKFARRKLFCAACQNIFFTVNGLKIHLTEDHFMNFEEANTLADYIVKNNCFGPTRKSKRNRIFIKNVQSLKKPHLMEHKFEKPKITDAIQEKPELSTTCLLDELSQFNDLTEEFKSLYPATCSTDPLVSCTSLTDLVSLQNKDKSEDIFRDRIFVKNLSALQQPMLNSIPDTTGMFNKENMFLADLMEPLQIGDISTSPSFEAITDDLDFFDNVENFQKPEKIKECSSIELLQSTITNITSANEGLEPTNALQSSNYQVDNAQKQNKIFIKDIRILQQPMTVVPSESPQPVSVDSSENSTPEPSLTVIESPSKAIDTATSGNLQQNRNQIFIKDIRILQQPHRTILPLTPSPPVVTAVNKKTSTSDVTFEKPKSSNNKIFIKDIRILQQPFSNQQISSMDLSESPSPPILIKPSDIATTDSQERNKIFIKDIRILQQPIQVSDTNSLINFSPTSTSTENNVERKESSELKMEEEVQSKNKIYVKNVKTLQQNDRNIPMTTVPLDSLSILGLSDLDNSFEVKSFLNIDQNIDDVVMLNESDLSALIEVDGDSGGNIETEISEFFEGYDECNNIDENNTEDGLYLNKTIEVNSCPKNSVDVDKNQDENVVKESTIHATEKCKINGCLWQFKHPDTLIYHKKCHDIIEKGKFLCPECEFESKNWNVLHTHLWRSHQIDMDLYTCSLCDFKTPILSRLKNEHMRIHGDARDFQCNQCDKTFKNAKQRKHHRRLYHKQNVQPKSTKALNLKLKTCEICSKEVNTATFTNHMKQHTEEKKYKCSDCNYLTNDHNAFRRHKMTHSRATGYKCPYCDYSSIQSTTYRKHLESKHSDVAYDLIFKCKSCKFVSISRAKYDLHIAKH